MIPQPTAREILEAIGTILEGTGYAGVLELSPAFNIDSSTYSELVRDGEVINGTVLEIGPGDRDPEGAVLVTNRRVFVNRFLSYGHVPEEPSGHGATTSEQYMALAQDEFAWALHQQRHLGFTYGHPTYSSAKVQHDELQEPEGQPRIDKETYNCHHTPSELVVMSQRC